MKTSKVKSYVDGFKELKSHWKVTHVLVLLHPYTPQIRPRVSYILLTLYIFLEREKDWKILVSSLDNNLMSWSVCLTSSYLYWIMLWHNFPLDCLDGIQTLLLISLFSCSFPFLHKFMVIQVCWWIVPLFLWGAAESYKYIFQSLSEPVLLKMLQTENLSIRSI